MSLLKRIEQGQADNAPVPSGGNNKSGNVPSVGSGSTPAAPGGGSRMGGIAARRVAPPGVQQRDTYHDLKTRVQNKLLAELDPSMDVSQTLEVRQTIEDLFETILQEENIVLSRPERRRLFEQIVAEILGLGPLEPLLADGSITEI
ncbi:MAG: hypothetical protein P8X64_11605, partial [Anaerolineales bacterium]